MLQDPTLPPALHAAYELFAASNDFVHARNLEAHRAGVHARPVSRRGLADRQSSRANPASNPWLNRR